MPKFNNCDFCHIHHHTEYSPFDGLAPMKKMVAKARAMRFPAAFMTDHGNMGGAISFIRECTQTKDKKGNPITDPPIKYGLGVEAYLCRKMEYKNKELQPDGSKGNRHLILVAKNFEGYQNLCTLVNRSWTEGFYNKPRIDIDLLAKYSKGLICTSACLGSVINANLLHDRYDAAKKAATTFKDMFGRDFFLEVMYHGMSQEKLIIPDIFKLSKELDIPVIATNDCHYLDKEQASSHEVFMCMSTSSCLTNPKHMKFPYDEFYTKSAEEMGKIFGHVPQVLYNTVAIADRIDCADIEKGLYGKIRLPIFDVKTALTERTDLGFLSQPLDADNEFKAIWQRPEVPENMTPYEFLCELGWNGLKRLGWDKKPTHVAALKKELRDVKVAWENNGIDFHTYFLILEDIISWAKRNGIIVGPGRGSGYASVLLRCLSITCGNVDPIEGGLIWERFLGFDDKLFVKKSDFLREADKVVPIPVEVEVEKDIIESDEEEGEFEEEEEEAWA